MVIAPSVHRSREIARLAVCESNLTQIGYSLQLYATANSGAYPDSLQVLVQDGTLPAELLLCPSSQDTPAPGASPAEQAVNLAKGPHQSYIYIGKGMTAGPANQVLVYEPPSHHGKNGINALFSDGSVKLLAPSAANIAIPQASTGLSTGPSTQPAAK